MAEKMYHAFWVDGQSRMHHIETFDDSKILVLRRQQDEPFCGVRELIVIYGSIVEFEPVKIVDTYKIKDE